ncbi:hypothetical protein ACX27_22065 [Nostoc piscinale CENA21]|uniref:Uncharacterized protein n=1 Tax=Nostoc piscinale CENA21 TaxID=224013 RepID=A0A0M3V622_9NOSO|nr:hypothetical protein [Nostoc piscinale]ALF54903.1 hypothetical protein ACX27_22065 [Nostoc piscinale CENA21]
MSNQRERFSGGDTDRVSFTLAPGVRQKVDDVLPILGGTLAKTLRRLVDLGLDLVDLAQKSGKPVPQPGNLEQMFSGYTSLGIELIFACESLGLPVPEVGQMGVWFVDHLSFGLGDIEGIKKDNDFRASRIFRLSREIQKFFQQQLNVLSEDEYAAFLRNLHREAIIGQEFVAACQTLGLQLPETGIQEWLQDLVERSRSLSTVESQLSNELLEECERLGIDPPKPGEVGAWLQNTRPAVFEEPMHEHRLPFTDDGLPLGGSQPFLEHLLTLNAPPTEDEEYDIAHRFGVDPAHLKELISRMRFDRNGQTNNCH